jgi:hypothetical protein
MDICTRKYSRPVDSSRVRLSASCKVAGMSLTDIMGWITCTTKVTARCNSDAQIRSKSRGSRLPRLPQLDFLLDSNEHVPDPQCRRDKLRLQILKRHTMQSNDFLPRNPVEWAGSGSDAWCGHKTRFESQSRLRKALLKLT